MSRLMNNNHPQASPIRVWNGVNQLGTSSHIHILLWKMDPMIRILMGYGFISNAKSRFWINQFVNSNTVWGFKSPHDLQSHSLIAHSPFARVPPIKDNLPFDSTILHLPLGPPSPSIHIQKKRKFYGKFHFIFDKLSLYIVGFLKSCVNLLLDIRISISSNDKQIWSSKKLSCFY